MHFSNLKYQFFDLEKIIIVEIVYFQRGHFFVAKCTKMCFYFIKVRNKKDTYRQMLQMLSEKNRKLLFGTQSCFKHTSVVLRMDYDLRI